MCLLLLLLYYVIVTSIRFMAVGQVTLCSSLSPILPVSEPVSDGISVCSDKTPNTAELDKGNCQCDNGFEENVATGLVMKYCMKKTSNAFATHLILPISKCIQSIYLMRSKTLLSVIQSLQWHEVVLFRRLVAMFRVLKSSQVRIDYSTEHGMCRKIKKCCSYGNLFLMFQVATGQHRALGF